MTIFNLLLLVLVLVFSTESMADRSCAGSNAYMLWGECSRSHSPLSQEGLASWWNPPLKPTPRIAQYQYDELLLVLQWPISFCNAEGNNCDHGYNLPDHFTVHGLWPNRNSGRVCCPTSNTGITPSPKISVELRPFMTKYWPNLKCRQQPEIFWGKEYAKHGSCFPEFRNQYQVRYFQKAHSIAENIGDVMAMLLRSGKTLERGRTYQVEDFKHVTIARGVRLTPRLRCSKAKGGRGEVQLQEIVFCTNRRGALKNCDRAEVCHMRIGGANEFTFPASVLV